MDGAEGDGHADGSACFSVETWFCFCFNRFSILKSMGVLYRRAMAGRMWRRVLMMATGRPMVRAQRFGRV